MAFSILRGGRVPTLELGSDAGGPQHRIHPRGLLCDPLHRPLISVSNFREIGRKLPALDFRELSEVGASNIIQLKREIIIREPSKSPG